MLVFHSCVKSDNLCPTICPPTGGRGDHPAGEHPPLPVLLHPGRGQEVPHRPGLRPLLDTGQFTHQADIQQLTLFAAVMSPNKIKLSLFWFKFGGRLMRKKQVHD